MDARWLGHRRPRQNATIGDIVICVDEARRSDVILPFPKKFHYGRDELNISKLNFLRMREKIPNSNFHYQE